MTDDMTNELITGKGLTVNDIINHFEDLTDAETVKHVRGIWGDTQKEFAERMRTSKQTISNWENGKSVPPTSMLGCNLLALEYKNLENKGWEREDIRAAF